VIPNNDPAAVDELFGYTGREWDSDVKLQYNRARWYDPAQGRWISQDPIGFSAGDVNLYRYVGNGVTGATDPSGLEEDFALEYCRSVRAAIEISAATNPLPNPIQTAFLKGIAGVFGHQIYRNTLYGTSKLRADAAHAISAVNSSTIGTVVDYGFNRNELSLRMMGLSHGTSMPTDHVRCSSESLDEMASITGDDASIVYETAIVTAVTAAPVASSARTVELAEGALEAVGQGTRQLWVYGREPFRGGTLIGRGGGRPFASIHPPGAWQTSWAPRNLAKRMSITGLFRTRPFRILLSETEAANFIPVPRSTPTGLIFKRTAGQYCTRVPGSVRFLSGEMVPATVFQYTRYYLNSYGEWVAIPAGTYIAIEGILYVQDRK
jgi:RHS repeat-associated protein